MTGPWLEVIARAAGRCQCLPLVDGPGGGRGGGRAGPPNLGLSPGSTRLGVSSDGRGLVSQAGSVLLWETMRVTGLSRALSQSLARWRAPRAVHDPGKVVADLAAAVALGGDCLADIAVCGSSQPWPGRLRPIR